MTTCPHCNSTTHQRRKGFSALGKQRYQCAHCGRQYTIDVDRRRPQFQEPAVHPCAECGRETTNPRFCSSSCAAISNNRIYPKRRKKERFCKYCNAPLDRRRKRCDNCTPEKIDWATRTVAEVQQAASYQASARIRDVARFVYRQSGHPYVCQNCGYDKHVEICHVRAINAFPDDTPVSVVNDLSNLIALCPNCHWELDNGLLEIR